MARKVLGLRKGVWHPRKILFRIASLQVEIGHTDDKLKHETYLQEIARLKRCFIEELEA